MYIYCFTLRCLKEPDLDSLEDIINNIKKKYYTASIEYHWEIVFKKNGKHNVHVHGLIKNKKQIFYNFMRLLVPKGYHFYINKCNNESAWLCYMNKTRYTKDIIKSIVAHSRVTVLDDKITCQQTAFNDTQDDLKRSESRFRTLASSDSLNCSGDSFGNATISEVLDNLIEVNPFDQSKIIGEDYKK